MRLWPALFYPILLLPATAPGQTPVDRCATPAWQGISYEIAPQPLPRTVATIPVVVHVVYRTGDQNISDAQILSQIEVLNEDYRALNDLDPVLPNFSGLIADLEITFCLASRDPWGQPTNGITRTQTPKDDIGLLSDVHYTNLAGQDAWDPERYLNIWVADLGGNFIGRASFPGQGLLSEDGVVIDPTVFGTIGSAAGSAPYHLGRTTTHEIGHYFDLLHVWGSGSPSCSGADQVADTPSTSDNYLNDCPESLVITCGSADMYTNFMYYTDDACMAQFTPGQKARVWNTLSGFRSGLLASDGCQPVAAEEVPENAFAVNIFPSPARDWVQVEWAGSATHLRVYDFAGRLLADLSPASTAQSAQWDCSAWPAGVYWAQVHTDRGRLSRVFVVQR